MNSQSVQGPKQGMSTQQAMSGQVGAELQGHTCHLTVTLVQPTSGEVWFPLEEDFSGCLSRLPWRPTWKITLAVLRALAGTRVAS